MTQFKFLAVFVLFAIPMQALCDTPAPGAVKARLYSGDGTTAIGVVGDAAKVNITNSIPLPSGAATESTLSTLNGKIPASPAQDRATATAPNSARLSDGTSFYKATTPSDTQPMSAVALPLPSGAAIAANQTTANASLSSIDGKLSSPLPVSGTFFQATQPVSISGTVPVSGALTDTQLRASAVPVSGSFFQVTQPISAASLPLPSGAATSAIQTTIQASLTSIDGKLNSLGQKAASASVPVVLASDQAALPPSFGSSGSVGNNAAITTTASTFTAPANAVGFFLEAESGNTANIRWAVGSTATASVGHLAEPGRDTGYIPMGANISVIAISGTQAASVQWVVK